MPKKKPAETSGPIDAGPVPVPASPPVSPAAPAATNRACEDVLMEIHDPSAEKSDLARRLLQAKRELDIKLGLIPAANGEFQRFGAAPFGGSNIVATEIHQKVSNGVNTGEFCISVLVKKKPPPGTHIFAEIPHVVGDGIHTDVIQVGQASPQATNAGGPVIGTPDRNNQLWRGTFGALVDCGDNEQYILSNQHVLNRSDLDNFGKPVLDGNFTPIGTLMTWTELSDPELDAALALVTNAAQVSSQFNGFTLDPNPMSEQEVIDAAKSSPSRSFLVKKVGQKTGPTTGTINGDSPFLDVNNGTRTLQRQWRITSISGQRFSEDGDSGSLIVGASNNRPIGLLWGGDNSSLIVSYANRISLIQQLFRISKFL